MRRIFLFLIRAYQLTLSSVMGRTCRFMPSCSQYAYDAIAAHGAWRGGRLAVRRLCKCHPFSGAHGYDPVPENIDKPPLRAINPAGDFDANPK